MNNPTEDDLYSEISKLRKEKQIIMENKPLPTKSVFVLIAAAIGLFVGISSLAIMIILGSHF